MSSDIPEISPALVRRLAAHSRQRDRETDDEVNELELYRRSLRAMRSQTERTFQSREDIIERLQVLRKALLADVDYSEGEIVQWKDGLRNRANPAYGEPVIVINLLDKPVFGDDDSGTPQFREPLDVIIGWVDDDGDFICYHYDKRRFRKFLGSSSH